MKLLGDLGDVEIGDKYVAIIHNPKIAMGISQSGVYDAVFYGHTHEAKVEKVGDTLLFNPGEIMGKNGNPSFGVWDSEKNEMKIVRL